MDKRTVNSVKKAIQAVKNVVDVRDPTGKCVEATISPSIFIDDRGLLHISGEDGYMFVDYYGEFRGGYPWIDPRLEEIAKAHHCYFEWDNPGSICLVD